MRNYQALESGSQGSHSNDVLFFDASATHSQLMDAAEWRMGAVRDLLDVLACSNLDDFGPRAVANSARALLLLTDDAAALYAAARQARKTQPEG